jgi:hypothetical protein
MAPGARRSRPPLKQAQVDPLEFSVITYKMAPLGITRRQGLMVHRRVGKRMSKPDIPVRRVVATVLRYGLSVFSVAISLAATFLLQPYVLRPPRRCGQITNFRPGPSRDRVSSRSAPSSTIYVR